MLADHAFNQIAACARDMLVDRSEYALSNSNYWRDLGYVALGSGHYSAVLEHPDKTRDTVIKIGRDIDDSWLAFAVYCMTNPSPVLPSIHKIKLFPRFYIVEMEKLETITWTERKSIDAGSIGKSRQAGYDTWAARLPKESQEALYSLESVLGKPNDLHGENVMRRGDQFVLIDPYADAAGSLPRKVKTYMPTRPEGMSDRVALEVDSERARWIAELATAGTSTTARAQEEVPALRKQSFDNAREHAERMARLLPQMRGGFMAAPRAIAGYQRAPFVAADFAGVENRFLAACLPPNEQHRPSRLAHLKRRLNSFDMALKGRDNRSIAGAVHGRMVGAARPRHIANIRPMLIDLETVGPVKWGYIPKAFPIRQPAQVSNPEPIPAELNIRLEERPRHFAKQHGRQPVQVRRGSGRRYIVGDTGGRVFADSIASGDNPERWQIRLNDEVRVCGSATRRALVRPGQGWKEGDPVFTPRAYALRFRAGADILP